MIQPACVVPSNAPPLPDRSQSTSTTRVLQELAGNQQPNPYTYAPPLDIKFPRANLLENVYPTITNPPTYPQHNRSIRLPVEPHGQYRSDDGLTLQEKFQIEHDAKLLYKRFLDSHQYSKYRQKQPKDVKNKADQKWSDQLERAFFYALVRWQPMGRRKHDWKAKLRGRNELIADAIQERTGIGRTRKQVSSHIQVLKPFVENDPFIMRYLSKIDSRGDRGPRVPGYTDGHQRSQFHVASAGLGTRQGPTRSSGRRVNDSPQTYTDPDAFVPVEFEMFVQRKHTPPASPTEIIDRLHTYTKQVSQPMGPAYHIPDSETLLREYPMLATNPWDRKSTHHVIAAEASLAMAMRPMNGMTGVELGISFRCRSECFRPANQAGAVQVRCASQFFEGQTRFEDDSQPPPVIEWHDVGGGMCEGQVKFGSNFWVKALSSGFKNAKERGAEYLEGISAVQDVYVVPVGAQPECILRIHWSFRLSAGECGRASWRRLIMPPFGSVYGLPVAKHEPMEESAFDFNDLNGPLPALSTSTSMPPHPPALQSPFPYESHVASTLSSTWPSNLSDLSTSSGLGIVGVTDTGVPQPYNNNDVDFLGRYMEFNFDPLALDGFDTSTFNFDAVAGGGSAVESFVADPTPEAYSQGQAEITYNPSQPQSQSQGWDEAYPGAGYDHNAAYAQTGAARVGGGGYTGHSVYDPQIYGGSTQESQAFEGAGADVGGNGGNAMHDASYSTQDMSGVSGQM
ncbi:hypothetical protein LTR95_003636 [Oleoguttula sp. CCFEE 5521]